MTDRIARRPRAPEHARSIAIRKTTSQAFAPCSTRSRPALTTICSRSRAAAACCSRGRSRRLPRDRSRPLGGDGEAGARGGTGGGGRAGKAEALPFEDGTFTCVASATAFFFFPDPVAVLREAQRVLRPEGRLAITTTPPEMKGTPAAPEPMASIGRFYTDEELVALAEGAGFADVSVTRDGRGSQLLTARNG